MMQPGNFPPLPEMMTDRLILRQLVLEDEREVLALRSDEAVVKYVDRPLSRTLDEARQFIHKMNAGIQNNGWLYWAIALKTTGKLVGTICIWNISEDEAKAEVGYELMPAFQGRGLMQEAIEQIIQHGFERMQLNAIEAYVHPDNAPSIKLLERNHFVRTGTFKDNDEFDMIIFNLSRS